MAVLLDLIYVELLNSFELLEAYFIGQPVAYSESQSCSFFAMFYPDVMLNLVFCKVAKVAFVSPYNKWKKGIHFQVIQEPQI